MSVNVANKLQVNSSYKGNDDLYDDIPINFKNVNFVNKSNNSAFEPYVKPTSSKIGVLEDINKPKHFSTAKDDTHRILLNVKNERKSAFKQIKDMFTCKKKCNC